LWWWIVVVDCGGELFIFFVDELTTDSK